MACSSCGSGGCSTDKVGGCNGGCSSGGCNRLNVFDWLADVEIPDSFAGFDLVEVRFKGGRKEFMRNDQRLRLTTGDAVVVEAAGSGWHLGHVSLKGELVRLQMRKKKVPTDSKEIRPILRLATPDDEERWQAVRDLENGTMFRSREIVGELRLKMKLSDVEYQADRTRCLFFYSAEDRVDFRDLIRRLADEFRVRVEMRQITLRQEAGRIGGIGICGRELCCSTWLTDFKAVSTTAARYQNLSLNPQKLAGQCGRLKCCLNYELDAYLDALKDIPQVHRPLKTAQGEAFLQKTDIFRRRMWFAVKGDHNWTMLDAARVKELVEINKRGDVIDSLLPPREEAPEPEVSAIVEGSLDRLDDSVKSSSGKRKRKKGKDGKSGETPTASGEGREGRERRPDRDPKDGASQPRENRPRREPRDGASQPRPATETGIAAAADAPGTAPDRAPREARPNREPRPDRASREGRGNRENRRPANTDPNAPASETPAGTEGQGRRGSAARPLNRRDGRGRGNNAPPPNADPKDGGSPLREGRAPTERRPEPNADANAGTNPRPPRAEGDRPAGRSRNRGGRNRTRRPGSETGGSGGEGAA